MKTWQNAQSTSQTMRKDWRTKMVCTPLALSVLLTVLPLQCYVDCLGNQKSTSFHQNGYLYWMRLPMPIMDWSQILSENLATLILGYRTKRSFASRVYPPFFFSTYVMDAIFFVSNFPIMGWRWTVQNPLPIQLYHKVLWESNFIPNFFKICHGVIPPIYL